ncbi:DDRGK domain-containing protein 1-like [Ambystoma mexicanum]|uniref:DDRGK domain-containing protein 1-like n=1 Tax=Ambystoma mexicanum TaxID=8296 RepID=UPI0037E8EA22
MDMQQSPLTHLQDTYKVKKLAKRMAIFQFWCIFQEGVADQVWMMNQREVKEEESDPSAPPSAPPSVVSYDTEDDQGICPLRELQAAEGYSNPTYKPPPFIQEENPRGTGQPASSNGANGEGLQRAKAEFEGIGTEECIAAQILLKLKGETTGVAEGVKRAIEGLERNQGRPDWAAQVKKEEQRGRDKEARIEQEEKERKETLEQEEREWRRDKEKERIDKEQAERTEREWREKEREEWERKGCEEKEAPLAEW